MPHRRIQRRIPFSDGELVTVFGIGLFLTMVIDHHIIHPEISDLYSRLFQLVLLSILSLSIAYAGHWVRIEEIGTNAPYGIFLWCLTGSLLTFSMAMSVLMIEYRAGSPLAEPGFILVAGAAVGAAGGTLVGIKNAGVEGYAQRVEFQQQSLLILNRLIRHHILNAIQIIGAYTHRLRDNADGSTQDDFNVINQQIDRIENLITNIRLLTDTFSRSRAPYPMNLNDMLIEVTDPFEEQFEELGLDLPENAVWVKANKSLSVGLKLVLELLQSGTQEKSVLTVSVNDVNHYVTLRIKSDQALLPSGLWRSSSFNVEHEMELTVLESVVQSFDGGFEVEHEPESCIVLYIPQAVDRPSS